MSPLKYCYPIGSLLLTHLKQLHHCIKMMALNSRTILLSSQLITILSAEKIIGFLIDVDIAVTETSASISGLQRITFYRIMVRALTVEGEGDLAHLR